MITRTAFNWVVTLMNIETGETKEVENYSYWSPDRVEGCDQEMAKATCAAFNTFNDRRRTAEKNVLWAPVSATFVKGEK